VTYWLHNGLTKVNTKKISKSDASPEMQAALAKMTLHTLLATYPPELIRYFVLATHYRSPIEYSDEEIASKKKGLDTFYRLFERVERLCGKSPYHQNAETPKRRNAENEARSEVRGSPSMLTAACEKAYGAFVEAMDDDFNTAGAIAAMFELAGVINRFIESEKMESALSEPRVLASGRSSQSTIDNRPSQIADVLSATGFLLGLGRLIGVFLEPPKKAGGSDGVADKAMQVLITIRQHLRKKKDFESADLLRNLLTEQKITLEDRPDGTIWRAE